MSGEEGPELLSDINDPLHQTRLLRLLQINTLQITNGEKHSYTQARSTHTNTPIYNLMHDQT